MNSWWTIIQCGAWIAARDERLVGSLRGESLAEAEAAVSREVSASDETSATAASVRRGISLLLEALKAGSVQSHGLTSKESPPVEIPVAAWLDLVDLPQADPDEIAASGWSIEYEGTRWDSLRVWDVQVMRHWPFPRRRRSSNPYGFEFRLDSIGEAMWSQRRWRMVANAPPMDLGLDADGLPERFEITLVEALSWCAFGKALPKEVWAADDTDLKSVDEQYAQARDLHADALYRFRRAWRDAKASHKADPESQSLRIFSGVAAQSVEQSRDKLKEALTVFLRKSSWRQLLLNTYEEVRVVQSFSIEDRHFPQRLADRAEEALFRAFLSGDLVCLGRRNASVPVWEALPKDYFRLPVVVRINHNILEPADQASMEDHKLIMEHAAKWVDLRVEVSALRRWHSKQTTTVDDKSGSSVKGVPLRPQMETSYVNEDRLEALRKLPNDRFDIRKLVRLCEELNSSYASGNYFATGMLVRAIIDHVPPVFGFDRFKQVVANYGGTRSFGEAMRGLDLVFRKMADQYLHEVVRPREELPNGTQVDFRQALDLLLGEVVRVLRS
jgi:hypothetical protein